MYMSIQEGGGGGAAGWELHFFGGKLSFILY